MKVIPWELQHRLVVVDVEGQKLKKSVKKSKRVVELVDTDSMDLWVSYKNGVLQACEELCGKTKGMGDRGNKHMVVERAGKGCNRLEKKAFKLWYTNQSTESKNNYRKARNKTK